MDDVKDELNGVGEDATAKNEPEEKPEAQPEAEETPDASQDGEGQTEPPTFDDLLKNGYQSEFDRRVTKAINTARTRWEQGLADAQTEAEKMAKMSESQRQKYQLDKDRKELEDEKTQFQKQRLQVQTGTQLQEMGYDAGFAKFLTTDSAETTNENLTNFDQLMRTYKASVVKSQMRGGQPPADPQKKGGLTKEQVQNMSAKEINKNWEQIQEMLQNKQ